MMSTMKKPSLATILGAVTMVAVTVFGAPSSHAQQTTQPAQPQSEPAPPSVSLVAETAQGYVRTIYGKGNSYFYLFVGGSLQGVVRTTTSDPDTPTVYNYEVTYGTQSVNVFHTTTGPYIRPNTRATFTQIPPMPEMDPGSAAGAISLLAGGVLTLCGRRRIVS